MTTGETASAQLETIGWLHTVLGEQGIDYWLFGGWAVDFHAGRVTRHHDDVDLAVWQSDLIASADCLRRTDGHMPLSRASRATPATSVTTSGWSSPSSPVTTPERSTRRSATAKVTGHPAPFGDAIGEVNNVHARVVSLASLIEDKSGARHDPAATAKTKPTSNY